MEVFEPRPAPKHRDTALEAIKAALASTLQEVPAADATVVASIASYVNRDGTLAESHSRYAAVSSHAVEAALSGVKLRLGHDGTLAARGVQPHAQRAAVIMLGTALGIGFSPPPASLCPLSEDFSAS